MSINDFMNKIKGKLGVDNTTLMFLCIIIGVGISSFCLGRISVAKIDKVDQLNIKEEGINISKNEGDIVADNSSAAKEKVYVASKNGKMYYSIGCSGAKRIKPENEVWFSTREDAEKSGYTLAVACK